MVVYVARQYPAIQWDGSNFDDVVAVIERRGPGTGFGPVTEQNGTLTVPSGQMGDVTLQQGQWFVANDDMGEFLSDADFQLRYDNLA